MTDFIANDPMGVSIIGFFLFLILAFPIASAISSLKINLRRKHLEGNVESLIGKEFHIKMPTGDFDHNDVSAVTCILGDKGSSGYGEWERVKILSIGVEAITMEQDNRTILMNRRHFIENAVFATEELKGLFPTFRWLHQLHKREG